MQISLELIRTGLVESQDHAVFTEIQATTLLYNPTISTIIVGCRLSHWKRAINAIGRHSRFPNHFVRHPLNSLSRHLPSLLLHSPLDSMYCPRYFLAHRIHLY